MGRMLCQLATMLSLLAVCPDSADHPTGGEYQNGMLEEAKETRNNHDDESAIEQVTEFFGTLVGTSPYPGVRSTYNGNDLMTQLSQVNQDLDLLIGHDKVAKFYEEKGYKVKYPHIMLSGLFEGTGFISIDATGHPQSNIGLTNAELDILGAYKALTGFAVFQYQNFPQPIINSRLADQNLFLDVAFVTIGDLNAFPMYVTIGQTFLPYGQYNSYNGFNDPLTEILFRALANDATIGYYDGTFLGQFFFLKGNNRTGSGNNINNYGFNLGAHYNIGNSQNLLQASFIRNIGDCLGFQVAFANMRNTNTLRHVVPGLNINGSTQIGDHWFFVYEYNTALRSFAVQDAAYSTNGGKSFKGARPQAFDIEGCYQFNIGEKLSGIALGYSQSFQAVGFNVPKWRLDLTYSIYIFKGTVLSLEYMHNKLYDRGDVAAGQVAFAPGGAIPYYRLPANKGHSDDTLTLDISFYW